MAESVASERSVILVDDEPAAIINLKRTLNGFEQLTVIAEVGDGESAIDKIIELRPDIVFLDIEMPGVNGFEVARETAHLHYQLVFVTAYAQYALDAFDTNAIDYLLKPVRPSLLEKCVQKILYQEELVLEALQNIPSAGDNVMLSDGSTTRVLSRRHITFIEGIGRYRRVHLDAEGTEIHKTATIVSDTTLDEFESQLSSAGFFRLHRSYIVNLRKAVALSSKDRRQYLRLRDTEILIPVSRSKVAVIRQGLA